MYDAKVPDIWRKVCCANDYIMHWIITASVLCRYHGNHQLWDSGLQNYLRGIHSFLVGFSQLVPTCFG